MLVCMCVWGVTGFQRLNNNDDIQVLKNQQFEDNRVEFTYYNIIHIVTAYTDTTVFSC